MSKKKYKLCCLVNPFHPLTTRCIHCSGGICYEHLMSEYTKCRVYGSHMNHCVDCKVKCDQDEFICNG